MSSLDPFEKLYRETSPCEHGETDGHLVLIDYWWCPCVVREEVTIDYEAATEALAITHVTAAQLARFVVDAALKSAGFTKKFASGESVTE